MSKIYSILFLSIFILNPLSAQSVMQAQTISELERVRCDSGFEAVDARCERMKAEKIEKLKVQNKRLSTARELLTTGQFELKDKISFFFPDDSHLGLKCTRNRATLGGASDYMGESPYENGGWWVLNKDYQDRYVNEYRQDAYFVLSPSNKKGWIIAQFIFMKQKSTDLWEFGAEQYRTNGPYEVTKLEISDYAYEVGFRDTIDIRFNREDLSWGFGRINRAGTCKIMDAAEFFSDIDSMEERAISYKAHNQKVVDARKAKTKF